MTGEVRAGVGAKKEAGPSRVPASEMFRSGVAYGITTETFSAREPAVLCGCRRRRPLEPRAV